MPAIKDSLKPLEMATVASSGLTGSYAAAKTLEQPTAILRVVNDSSETVLLSYDGSTDHDAVDSGQTLHLEAATNREPQNERSILAKNTVISLKGTAGQGNIYITGYYHPG
jgi:hypothetical protein